MEEDEQEPARDDDEPSWVSRPERSSRVVLAHEQASVLARLRVLLTEDPSLIVVGEVRDGSEVVSTCLRLRPDLLVMNVDMPLHDAAAATRTVRAANLYTRVLLVGEVRDFRLLRDLAASGAAGYISSNARNPEMLRAVRAVLRNQRSWPRDPPIGTAMHQ
jgi:DNA-binding NarL/FixJ family response regulator